MKRFLPKKGSHTENKREAGTGIEQKRDEIRSIFHAPSNKDLVERNVYISSISNFGVIFYLKGTVNQEAIENQLIKSLLTNEASEMCGTIPEMVKDSILTNMEVNLTRNIVECIDSILSGNSLLIVDHEDMLVINTTGFEKRSVEKPENEHVLKGPKESFIESIAVNISLVRKQLKSQELITEYMNVGNKAVSQVGILYMNDVVGDGLVEKVKKRINEISIDQLQNLEILEQHLEERPYSIIPTLLYTERPDRAVAFLKEGHVVLLMDTSSSCLIAPVTFWSLFQTSEDSYSRWFYGNFSRLIRLMAIFVTVLTPALYIAITDFHEEMLPTDLVLSISATRQKVPFPAVFEIILLSVAFELIREGGVRVPSPIGPTIGIVGALILGQAAVQANIISPILVIVVALTGLASFAIPNLSFNYMIRLTTYLFLIAGSFFGLFGIAGCLTACIAYMASVTSFGVPFLAPMAPHYRSSKDLIVRPPMWKQWLRPFHVLPKEVQRMQKEEGNQSE
ncbi:spore germination protein [Falsibacillus albus]|uniref:spore germination protein n=1 Tax=Falsibacillus albus TaxID=2478915 RepID=UPI001F3B001C|nr:spore germination protein [Falsibacillus albus]